MIRTGKAFRQSRETGTPYTLASNARRDCWHVIMSTSKGSGRLPIDATLGDLMRHFGVDDADLAAAGRVLEAIVRGVESLLASAKPALLAATPAVLALAARLESLSREPETPGHEKLFTERLGQDPLRARLSTRTVHYLGQLLADETNQGRRVRAIIDEIVKARESSTLVIARRAKRFRDECDSHGACVAIDGAAKKAGLSCSTAEFRQLIDAACERDEGACRELGRTAVLLAPHLPAKSGRPISTATCIHLMLLTMLEHEGNYSAYTYSDLERPDFVDPVTQATRQALNKPRFSPLRANRLRKARPQDRPKAVVDRRSPA
jgi:hypothetical protein